VDNSTGTPYYTNEEEFEWDAAKAKSNIVKHGVSFKDAQLVFDDMFAFERPDFDSAAGEIRYVITGSMKDIVPTVVYTERGDHIRIISARKATTYEREYYRNQTAQ